MLELAVVTLWELALVVVIIAGVLLIARLL